MAKEPVVSLKNTHEVRVEENKVRGFMDEDDDGLMDVVKFVVK